VEVTRRQVIPAIPAVAVEVTPLQVIPAVEVAVESLT